MIQIVGSSLPGSAKKNDARRLAVPSALPGGRNRRSIRLSTVKPRYAGTYPNASRALGALPAPLAAAGLTDYV